MNKRLAPIILSTMIVTSLFMGCSKSDSSSTVAKEKSVAEKQKTSDSKTSTDKAQNSTNESPKAETSTSTQTAGNNVTQVDKAVEDNIINMSLGLTYDNAVKLWGEPNMNNGYSNGNGLLNFKDNLILATFMNGRLWNLTMQFEVTKGSGNGLTPQELKDIIPQLLPKDTKLISKTKKTDPSAPGYEEDILYKSESLGKIFDASQFTDANTGKEQIGEFLIEIQYNDKGEAFGLAVGTGNNP